MDGGEHEREGGTPGASRRPRLLGLKELLARNIHTKFLIEDVLPTNVNAMLYADEMVGKSFTALDIGLTIASARKTWHGHPVVTHGPVVYVVAENEDDQPKRVRGWMQAHGDGALSDETPFHMYPGAVNLFSGAGLDALLAEIAALPQPPVLVIFDTLHACTAGGDEDKAKDAGLVIDNCNRIRAETEGAAVLLIHHTGKSANAVTFKRKGTAPRGSSALIDGCTVRIEATRTGAKQRMMTSDIVTLTCRKMSVGLGFPEIKLPARIVTVDAHGKVAATIVFDDRGASDLAAEDAAGSSDQSDQAATTSTYKTGPRVKKRRIKREEVYTIIRDYGPIWQAGIAERLGVEHNNSRIANHVGRLADDKRVRRTEAGYAAAQEERAA